MTLSEFNNKVFRCGQPYCEIRVTDNDDIFGEDDPNIDDVELLFTLKGDYKAETYLQDKYCQAEVQEIYALAKNIFLVVI